VSLSLNPQEFIDLHIQCEDGVLAAHRLVLAACSPFIRSLILDLGGEATSEPVLLLLPDVKMNLVQTLLQLLYAGQVTAQEGQFYSLMKLVLDLDVSASIEAEKTNAAPTKFETMPVAAGGGGTGECAYGEGMRPRKRSRIDTFDSLIMEGSSSVQQQQSRITGSVTFQHEEGGLQQMWQKPGGLVVNSLTASGVEVKQEPEEDNNSNSSSMDHHHHLTDRKGGNNSSSSGSFHPVVQASYALAPSSTNSANNNNSSQLGHFVSVSPGYQVPYRYKCPSGKNCRPVSMLRIRDVYLGSGILIFVYPSGSNPCLW
jgi:hypothetical protein